MADDDLATLVDRPGWRVESANVAVFEPIPGGWVGRVTRLALPARAYDRFHIALITPAGVARYTQHAGMVGEARRVAEGWVRGQQPG